MAEYRPSIAPSHRPSGIMKERMSIRMSMMMRKRASRVIVDFTEDRGQKLSRGASIFNQEAISKLILKYRERS